MEALPDIILTNSGNVSIIGIYIAALVANLFPFVPEEVFLLGYGYLNGIGVVPNFARLSLFLVLGLFTSDIVVFTLARRGNKIVHKFLSTIIGKDYRKHERFIIKHRRKVIVISRFLTSIRAIGPILAGSVKTPWKEFLTYNALALAVYVPLILLIGRYFEDRIEGIVNGIDVVGNVIGAVLFLLGVIVLIQFMRKTFIKKIRSHDEGVTLRGAFKREE